MSYMGGKTVLSIFLGIIILSFTVYSQDAFALDPITAVPNSDAMTLANSLNLPFNITNAQYVGSPDAAGTFTWTNPAMSNGLILSSGKIASVNPSLPGYVPPGQVAGPDYGTEYGLPGNPLLQFSSLGCPSVVSKDASVLTIEFDSPSVPQTLNLEYLYGTQDFPPVTSASNIDVTDPAYGLCSDYSDRFGVFLTGGTLTNHLITFDANYNPISSTPSTFTSLGFNNDYFTPSDPNNPTPFNAITKTLQSTISLDPNTHYVMTIAIGDSGDQRLDSFGLIRTFVPLDSDGDGVPDSIDNCPTISNPDQTDSNNNGVGDACETNSIACGTGTILQGNECVVAPQTDSDGDGTPDVYDLCPSDPNKISPGLAGCGNTEPVILTCGDGTTLNATTNQCIPEPLADSDNDGVPNAYDFCPDDPNKVFPGITGCGNNDYVDSDGDGVPDVYDQCPANPDRAIAGPDGCSETPSDMINNLTDALNSLGIDHGTQNSLDSKLAAALSSFSDNHNNTAINQLNAFINEVNAQAGKKISHADADQLIADAQNIINAIS